MLLSYLRTGVLYLILIAVVRVMGKRQIGEMEPAEFVVTMLVANLAAIPMQDSAIPLYSGLVPILTVLGVELVLSWLTLKSVRARELLCGKPVIVIDNGKVLPDNLRAARVTLDELTSRLRQKDVLDITTVQFAILETNGTISVFPYAKDSPASAADAGVKAKEKELPVTLVSDGQILNDNLRALGLDEKWLHRELEKQSTALESTLLFTRCRSGKTQLVRKEAVQ